ncbi:DUF4844 domain-containing protein [Sphingobacterium sp. SRCM116780]|uniref:DUF4844 domain-containing protein n=1 Tax=Sphingobacterium sp. SRCM116780 TaxID=2907623 RepID=UPI001F3B59C4|nr:DUF4844 domain-containing protein [Sphingobacterium sp. SRCM116780]UIR56783.1 DUF4844 domain-containing protein [Sphingobacterium sp. SRCM116780]
MQNQTQQIIELNKKQTKEETKKLQQQNVLTSAESEQLNNRLVQDLDYYLNHQDIDAKDITRLFKETVQSFENIKITHQVFIVIASTYYCISSQRMMRNYPPKIEMEIQIQVNKAMNDWFAKYQTGNDRLDDLIIQVKNYKKLAFNKDIKADEYTVILNTLTTIRQDGLLTDETMKQMLLIDMAKYANRSNNSNLEILNIYNTVNDIRNLGIEKELTTIYDSNFMQSALPTYSQLKKQVTKRFKWMLQEDLIETEEYVLFTQTILSAIDFCEKSNDDDKEVIKERLVKSIGTLSRSELETEDREAVVDWYYMLAEIKNVNINEELNHWLYPFLKK